MRYIKSIIVFLIDIFAISIYANAFPAKHAEFTEDSVIVVSVNSIAENNIQAGGIQFNCIQKDCSQNNSNQNICCQIDSCQMDGAQMDGAQRVGVVLSGGGAKGLSHIGVIRALEENNIPIDYICGTSMGAIIAGLYAIGYSPDEMIELFSSRKFDAWFRGEPEYEYCSFFYRDEPTPALVNIGVGNKGLNRIISTDKHGQVSQRNRYKIELPTSVIKPYPMDLEFFRIFAPASKVSNFNFDSLMVPFFCVSSDIAKKREFVSKSGDLSAAVRASMTYPFFFKPITIDSTLLFDGGFYNNFPWEIMENEFSPDYIIGVKSVSGRVTLDEESIVDQVKGMLVIQTDYNIPKDKGVIISRDYPYGVMDFKKLDEIVEMGYQNAQPYIKTIKDRIKRERSAEELADMRGSFKSRCKPILIDSLIDVSPNMSVKDKVFITKTLKNGKSGIISFETFKRGYYRVVATNTVKTFYPTYERTQDSLYKIHMKVTKSAPWKFSIGGNISSSSLNQGYVGVSYHKLGRYPWKAGAGMNIGKFYRGVNLSWKQFVNVKPLAYMSADFVMHEFDYYSGNQDLFSPDKLPNNVKERETYLELTLGTALSIRRNVVAKLSLVAGRLDYRYFFGSSYMADDRPNRTYIDLIYPRLSIERDSHNYHYYPTEGSRLYLGARYILGRENFKDNQTKSGKPVLEDISNRHHHSAISRFYIDNYFYINRRFTLGYMVDLTISTTQNKGNYYSTLLYMPVFQPVPHNTTLMMERYRANQYLGAAISPVYNFSKSFYIHSTFAYFQPWRQIENLGDGKYKYSETLPAGGFIGNMAIVWQSPLGPVSLASTYYSRGDYNQWYTQLNIGMLIFKKRMIR